VKKKIHIIGGPGSGKTFVAKTISEKFGIPHLDLDDIFWDKTSGYGNKADEQSRNEKLERFLDQSSWVVEGVYYQWLGESFDQADIIVILRTSRWLRHWRIIRRFVQRKLGLEYSKSESLRSLVDLLKYNHSFDRGQLQRATAAMHENRNRVLTTDSVKNVLDAL
jgi:adenylate kinase family enzyme